MGILAGGALIILGTAFLLAQLGHLGSMRAWHFWPLVLILAGLLKIVRPDRPAERVWGLLFVAGGTAAQLHYLHIIHLQWSVIWPALLILVGVIMLGSTLFRSRSRRKKRSTSGADSVSEVDAFVVFGGREDNVDSKTFQGGEILCVMGGYTLDLRDAGIENGSAVLRITAVMGGVEIRVPNNWKVAVKASPIMGAFEDKTRSIQQDDDAPEQRLVIEGSAVMGGVEITN
jgi:predicted membrane protein